MAQRRMFSPQIVDSDAFLDMPSSAQNLYFHLGMRADDDGFIGNPKKIMKIVSASDDDLKILLAKRFLLSFEDGVVVIKHWLIHNQIRKDRYHETQYLDHKKTLQIKDNMAYTDNWQPVGNQLATQVRLGKDSLDREDSSFSEGDERVIEEVGKDIDEDGNPIKKKKVKLAQPADVRVDEIVAEWNKYPTASVLEKGKVPNITAEKKLLPEARLNPLLAKQIREKLKSISNIEDWKHAIKKYMEDIINRDATDKYATHRFSLYEFVYQQNGLPRFINR